MASLLLPIFPVVHLEDWHWHVLVLWFICSACCQGWGHFAIRSRDLLCPLKVLSNVEQGSIGLGQAQVCDLCLSGIARMTEYFSKYFTSFSGFCTCSEVWFQNVGGVHCPRHLPLLSHTPCHSSLSNLSTDLWVVFLNSCLTINTTQNTFRRPSNRNMLVWTSWGYSEFSRAVLISLEKRKMEEGISPP